jgi:hypothetical protein
MAKPTNVTQYVAAQHAAGRKALNAVRALAKTAAPRAVCQYAGGSKALEFWIPDVGTALRVKAMTNHFELSPATPMVRRAMKTELAPFGFARDDRPYRKRGAGIRTGTGGQDDRILIRYDVAFPRAVIARFIKLRAAERIAKARAEKKVNDAARAKWLAVLAKREAKAAAAAKQGVTPNPSRREREMAKHIAKARASRLAWDKKIREQKKRAAARSARK